MKLSTAFRLSSGSRIALVGAGGKTTALFTLARELTPALVAASTHLGEAQAALADRHIIWPDDEPLPDIEPVLGQGVTLLTGPLEASTGRLQGLNPAQLEKVEALAGYHDLLLLIEADGSRMRPVKAPAAHEPAIPPFVDTVVVVAGLSAIGKPLTDEWVHRSEIFAALAGLAPGGIITPEGLARLLVHPEGGLKHIPAKARRLALLNQADTTELQAAGQRIAGHLLSAFHAVVVARLKVEGFQVESSSPNDHPPTFNRQSPTFNLQPSTFESIAGIVLAAGGSARFGQPKQLLDWQGEPFVRRVAHTALQAGLSPVVVVTGSDAERVGAALDGLDIRIAYNPDWEQGQSTSLRAGLQGLYPKYLSENLPDCHCERSLQSNLGFENNGIASSPNTLLAMTGQPSNFQIEPGGAIFLLADQPQTPPTLIRSLVEMHARTLAPIIAPLVNGQRGNPVLFDRATFSDLLSLTGDVGGRSLFSRYPVEWLPWHDEGVLLDVDTEEDYSRLVGKGDVKRKT